MASDISPKGIGGWLGLLIFWVTVVRPSSGVVLWWQMHERLQVEGFVDDSSPLINTSILWLLVLSSAALGIYAGIRLICERSPAAVRGAILIIWITIPLSVLEGVVAQA